MTENVAVDESPSRPVGAQLAVLADRAAAAPGDAVERVVFHELPAAWHGAAELARDWRWWVDARAERGEVERKVARAQANGAGTMPVPFKEVAELRKTRYLRSAAALAALLLGLAVCSVAGFWSWHPWRWWGPALAIGLLAVGKYYGRAGRWVARLSWVPVPVFLTVGIEGWRWWPWWVAAGVLVLVCEQRGMRMAREMPRPPGTYDPDDPPNWKTIWNTVEQYFDLQGKTIHRGRETRPITANGAETGVGFTLRSTAAIVPEEVRALERELGFPVNGSRWVMDPKAAGAGELRLCWDEPLPEHPNPRREPMSLSYTRPFRIASREGGRITELSLNRTRVLLAGDSGSGKSEALQVILDAVCDMPDATWSAIDLQDGPTFPAYAGQWNCTGVYTDLESATKHVQRLRAWCKARNRQLKAGVDYDEDGLVDAWWVVSDEPGRRGHVLLVDELSTATVDKGFAGELTLLLEVIRKASASAVLATPDLDKDRVPRAVIDQTNVQLGFACPFSDSQQLFGKGSTQSGWEPYELVPADGDEHNDAGKCFIRGGGLNRPEAHRFGVMDKHERRDRNKLRRLWRERMGVAGLADEPVDAVEVPEPLATLERLVIDGDVRTQVVLDALGGGWTARALGEALKPYGLAPTNVVVDGVQGREQGKGYRADQVKRAVAALDG